MKEHFGFWFELAATTDDLPEQAELARKAGNRLLITGVLLGIAGVLALANTFIATQATMLVLGFVLLAGGVMNAVQAITCRKWNIALLDFLAAAIYIVAGVFFFLRPVAAAETVTILLSALFVVGGLIRFVGALAMQPAHWGWMLFNGAATLLLGLLLFAGLPISGLIGPGLLVGVDLLCGGATAVAFGVQARRAVRRQERGELRTVTKTAA